MQKPDGQLAVFSSRNFLTLPGESVILAKRKHWFLPLLSIAATSIGALLFVGSIFFLGKFFLLPFSFLFITILVIFLLATALAIKMLVEWYYHLYIVTTRKILEVCYSPLSSYKINDVLLDQVKCTEVDARINGIVCELLEMGDVILTFDRPTHQEEFALTNIANPRKTGVLLGDMLIDSMRLNGQTPTTVWYRPRQNPDVFKFTEEIV